MEEVVPRRVYNKQDIIDLFMEFPIPSDLESYSSITHHNSINPITLGPSDNLPSPPVINDDDSWSRASRRGANPKRGKRGAHSKPVIGADGFTEVTRWKNIRNKEAPRKQPKRWCYKDPTGTEHGPFSTTQMQEWWDRSFFKSSLPVKCYEDAPFVSLETWFAEGKTAFLDHLPEVHAETKINTTSPILEALKPESARPVSPPVDHNPSPAALNTVQPASPVQKTISSPSIQPAPIVKPIQPPQPAPIAKPIQPPQPAPIAKHIQPAPIAKHIQPAPIAKPIQPPQPAPIAKPIQPPPIAKPIQPPQPAPIAKPIQPSQPAPIAKPIQPPQPAPSAKPIQPQPAPIAKPIQPTHPIQPIHSRPMQQPVSQPVQPPFSQQQQAVQYQELMAQQQAYQQRMVQHQQLLQQQQALYLDALNRQQQQQMRGNQPVFGHIPPQYMHEQQPFMQPQGPNNWPAHQHIVARQPVQEQFQQQPPKHRLIEQQKASPWANAASPPVPFTEIQKEHIQKEQKPGPPPVESPPVKDPNVWSGAPSKSTVKSFSDIQQIQQRQQLNEVRSDVTRPEDKPAVPTKTASSSGPWSNRGAPLKSLKEIQMDEEHESLKNSDLKLTAPGVAWQKSNSFSPSADVAPAVVVAPRVQQASAAWQKPVKPNIAQIAAPAVVAAAPAPKQKSSPKPDVNNELFWEPRHEAQKNHKKKGGNSAFGGPVMRDDFKEWCKGQMLNLNGNNDITLCNYLFTLQSADEIRSYVKAYLGSNPSKSDFAEQFISHREFSLANTKPKQEEVVTRTNRRKKKKKNQVDASQLSFTSNAGFQ